MKLTGKGRMTFYRYMDAGKLAYAIGMDNRRYVDTSELIRVFGDLKPVIQEAVPEKAKPIDVTNRILIQLTEEVQKLTAVSQQQSVELTELRKENAAQTEQLETINKQLEARPLLEAPREVEPAIVSDSNKPPVSTGKSEYSGIIQRMKDRQKA